jgi:hypothetical protein
MVGVWNISTSRWGVNRGRVVAGRLMFTGNTLDDKSRSSSTTTPTAIRMKPARRGKILKIRKLVDLLKFILGNLFQTVQIRQ